MEGRAREYEVLLDQVGELQQELNEKREAATRGAELLRVSEKKLKEALAGQERLEILETQAKEADELRQSVTANAERLEEIPKLRGRCNALESDVAYYRESELSLTRRLKLLESECEVLRGKLAKHEMRASDAPPHKVEDRDTEVAALKSASKRLEKELLESQMHLASLESENEALEHETQERIKCLEMDVQSRDQALQNAEKALTQEKENVALIANIRNQITLEESRKWSKESKKIRESLRQMIERVSADHSKVSKLQDEITNKEIELSQLRKTLTIVIKDLDSAKAEVEMLKRTRENESRRSAE